MPERLFSNTFCKLEINIGHFRSTVQDNRSQFSLKGKWALVRGQYHDNYIFQSHIPKRAPGTKADCPDQTSGKSRFYLWPSLLGMCPSCLMELLQISGVTSQNYTGSGVGKALERLLWFCKMFVLHIQDTVYVIILIAKCTLT